MQTPHQQKEWYSARFAEFERFLNGGAGTPLHGLRRAALESFVDIGFPTTKDEEWRFTNVSPIAKTSFVPVLYYNEAGIDENKVESFVFKELNAHRLVFVNGHFSKRFSTVGSLPDGVRLESLASALRDTSSPAHAHLGRYAPYDKSGFTALQTAFLQDGAFLFVPNGIVLDEPIHLIFLSSPDSSPFTAHPRTLLVIGNDARVSIVESYVAAANNIYLTNMVSEVALGEGSILEHDKLQVESSNAYHVGSTFLYLGARSVATSNSIALGGSLVRNNVTAVFRGDYAECTLNGLSLASNSQLVDNHTTIDHAQPNCASHELYKSILDGRSRGVFNGKIFVRKDAQKTDAKQTNKTLLLSDDATIDTKPQLEIFADDVKCTHGATVGQLDQDQVFYLRSRGIDEEMARDILTFAFASDVAERIHVEPLRLQLHTILHQRLRQGRVATQD